MSAASWPPGTGEMARRVRAHDWAATPLGPVGDWPQSLRSVVDIVLASRFPGCVVWGPGLVTIYNDAFRPILGTKPEALGRPFSEVWSEAWEAIGPIAARAFAGEATFIEDYALTVERHGYPEQASFTFCYSPVRDETGAVAGFLDTVVETTGKVLAERRQTFLLHLEERLRGLTDPHEVALQAAEALGRHLGAARAGYAAMDADGRTLRVTDDWTDGRVRRRTGQMLPLDAFGPVAAAELRAGRVVVVQDCLADPRTAGEQAASVWAGIGVRALVTAPLVKAGALTACFYAHDTEPRRWPASDVELIRDVGERTWAAVERGRAEAARRDSEERFRLMADAVPQIIWITDAEGRAEFFNEQWFAYTGAPRQPITAAETAAGYVHPDDATPTMERFEAARRTGGTFLVEHRIRSRDGQYRWFLVRGDPHRDPRSGDVVRWFGASIDIHDRKLAEARLRELNATLESQVTERTEALRLYRDIIEADRSPVLAFDHDHRVTVFNRAHGEEFFRVFGHRAQLGEVLPDLFPPDQAFVLRSLMGRALAGESFTVVEEFGDPDLAKPAFEVSYRPLRDAAGQIIGAFHHAKDVTDRLRAEAELREAQEALRQAQKMEAVGQLTGGLAHDFNNLLGAVIGGFDLIRRRAEDPDRVRRYAEAGLQAAERGAKLTAQLLAFSRAQRLERRPLVVAEVVEGMRDLLARSLGPGVRLTFELDRTGVAVLSDPTQVEMAVLNLAINARDAMPDGGELAIRTVLRQVGRDPQLAPGEYLELSVSDTGTGMPPEVAARAFDPFFTTKGVGKGTGLGLSQVYGVARQAGGVTRIESRPGAGTTVRVLLPRAETDVPATPTEATEVGTPEAASASILVIDDDEDMRRMLADLLDALGYRARAAADGPAGLASLDAETPELVVVDFAMPGMNGAEVAEAIWARHPEMPILFASGYADTAAIEAVAGETAAVLRKPFRIDELQAALSEALAARS